MPLVIHCPKCSKRYQVADAVAGKQVRCQQCQTAFVAAAPLPVPATAQLAPQDLFASNDPLAGADLSLLPAVPLPARPLGGANPLGTPMAGSSSSFYPAAPHAAVPGASNPSGGPTDAVMRMICGGMLALGIVLIVGTIGLEAATGSFYIIAPALAPLALLLGIAGLISPNVVRAVGKYGGHLSWQYKAMGYGVLALYFVSLVLLLIGFFAAGFRPG